MNESVNLFVRVVNEKHAAVRQSLDSLMDALVSENQDVKYTQAGTLLEQVKALDSILSSADKPSWLSNMKSQLERYANKKNSVELNRILVAECKSVHQQQWSFENQENISINFDAIFDHYRDQSRLPELFDAIIKLLREIYESGEIDSIKMLEDLKKIIATLEQSKRGSYFSTNSGWTFARTFLKNWALGELRKLPVLGTAVEALEKTIEETDHEMFEIHIQVNKDLQEKTLREIKCIEFRPDYISTQHENSPEHHPKKWAQDFIDGKLQHASLPKLDPDKLADK